jgi:putative transposase
MLGFKGVRFPIDVILSSIRWYAAYLLSYRHLEQMMEECDVLGDHSTIDRWAIRSLFLLEKLSRKHKHEHNHKVGASWPDGRDLHQGHGHLQVSLLCG